MKCINCGNFLEEGVCFCEKCGTSINASTLEDTMPTATNSISTSCVPEKKNLGIAKHKKTLICSFAIILGLLVSFLGYRYYQENTYLQTCSSLSSELTNKNTDFVNSIKELSKSSSKDISSKNMASFKENKVSIENILQEYSSRSVPEKYDNEDKQLAALLRQELAIITKAAFIIENPTEPNIDAQIKEIKKELENLKGTIAVISIPKSNFTLLATLSLDILPEQLLTYTRLKNREKMNLLQHNNFLRSINNLVQKYDAKKYDMGSMLENVRTGAYSRQQYLSNVNMERQSRIQLRNEAFSLIAPPELNSLKSDFINILTLSIDYCNSMYSAGVANISVQQSQSIYSDAQGIDKNVQEKYAAFLAALAIEKQ